MASWGYWICGIPRCLNRSVLFANINLKMVRHFLMSLYQYEVDNMWPMVQDASYLAFFWGFVLFTHSLE
jgi:hypothetical protein